MHDTIPIEAAQAVHLEVIGQIAIGVRDLARSREFYQNALGMKFLFDAGQMAFFQCGSVRLMLGLSESAESEAPRGGTILYYRVADEPAGWWIYDLRSVR